MNKRRSDPARRSRRAFLGELVGAGGAALGAALCAGSTYADTQPPRTTAAASRRLGTIGRRFKGEVFWKGSEGYEAARGAAVWRANKPPRFPEVVVLPHDEKDVVAAVRFARRQGLRVGVRSGGHSWTSPHVRDGAMLLDLSRMRRVEVDPRSRSVWTHPAVWGSTVNAELGAHGLITPTAHHLDVGIGGFVLCGGFGWNSRLWGNGSEHLLALDVVTADGELIRADASRNSDFYWAARGAGPGYFGVATRLQLAAHPLPPVWRVSVYSYPAEVLEELLAWARSIAREVAPFVELVITSSAHDGEGNPAPVRLTVAALALADTVEQADRALAILDTCPVADKATRRRIRAETNLMERYESGTRADPPGFRFACDNMYTDAPAEALVPRLRELFTALPTPRSHVFWLNWAPGRQWPDVALSVQADIYLAAYTVWDDPVQDERFERWPVEQIGRLRDLSAGGQMNDENMHAHPQRYLSEAAERRLELLRRKHDPTGLFVSFLRA